MKAYVIPCYEDDTTAFVVDIFDETNWVPVHSELFLTEFAAQTYADAINTGVIQHVEA